MGRPYSLDIRERAVFAVVREGMSCHAAADRFTPAMAAGVSDRLWMLEELVEQSSQ